MTLDNRNLNDIKPQTLYSLALEFEKNRSY